MGGCSVSVVDLWAEGRHHGFPPCCIARFVLDPARLLGAALPAGRVSRMVGRLVSLGPRHAVADGMVPCEGHLVHYLLTGDRSSWRRRRTAPLEACCEARAYFEAEGLVAHERGAEVSDPETGEVEARLDLWMVEGVGAVSYCPWCGQRLP